MQFQEQWLKAKTLGDLKSMDYRPRSVKEELRENLIQALREKRPVFEGILGYEDSVIPDLQRAILSKHNIILLGLRGQAKTRIARQLVHLLDSHMPVVAGAELHDDPFHPISRFARDLIAEKGDKTPIEWVTREERFTEKLATPDVTTADLIGDVDPIKAATLKLPYSDERVIHYGLVPHAHRGLFIINELPDLQPRIQVALFNILQEGDIQIRGFKLRLPLDIQFIFTANPEDYTNRGSIVTPLKDRIESQILTHHPKTIDISKAITQQEARLADWQKTKIDMLEPARDLVEMIAAEARNSDYIDQKSGVSARLTISAYELLNSAIERRTLLNGEESGTVRLTDLWNVLPAITGKVELVYEGEQEGPQFVAHQLIGAAIKSQFLAYFPDPEALKDREEKEDINPYQNILEWFAAGHTLDLVKDANNASYQQSLEEVSGLRSFVEANIDDLQQKDLYYFMELLVYGLAECGQINKTQLERGTQFNDFLSGMLNDQFPPFDED